MPGTGRREAGRWRVASSVWWVACGMSVESKRERMKKLNCLSIQEKENTKLVYREKTIRGEAEYHNRSPKPSTSAGTRPPPQHGGYKPPA